MAPVRQDGAVRLTVDPPRGALATLGEIIAAYRRRRRQPHRDVPWPQEELAFASGTDQAHISRIESNRQHPEYSTLSRICDALELSLAERAYVLAVAGYRLAPALPDEDAVTAALAKLAPLLDSFPYPASLIDEGERLWHLNPLAVALWGDCYGSTDRARCLALVRGRRTVEMIFDPEHYPERRRIWAAYYADIERVLMRNVALLWRAHSIRVNDPEMSQTVARLLANPDFRRRWEQVGSGEDELLFVEHATYAICNPTLGRLNLHSWRTHAAADERFVVTHFSPVDSATSRVLERLSESRLRRPRLAPATAPRR
ncbi:MAG TPA: helix-turn-helix domain-containing protein [Chloroflexota bacterium]